MLEGILTFMKYNGSADLKLFILANRYPLGNRFSGISSYLFIINSDDLSSWLSSHFKDYFENPKSFDFYEEISINLIQRAL